MPKSAALGAKPGPQMKKKVILLSIILFPSLIYLFFEMTKANFKKMAYFGPKTVNEKGDTIYYTVPEINFMTNSKIRKEVTTDKEGYTVTTLLWKADSTFHS